MSRWLWALPGASSSSRSHLSGKPATRECHPAGFAGPNAVARVPVPPPPPATSPVRTGARPLASARTCASDHAAGCSRRLLPLRPRRPLPLQCSPQDSKPLRRLLPRRLLEPPSAPAVVAQEPPSLALLCRRTAPAAARAGTGGVGVSGVLAPKSLAQSVGTWAYSEEDCERLFQRRGDGRADRQPVDKFAQAAIVESDEEDPSAFRHLLDRWRDLEADGGLKVSADCEDLIGSTSRSATIALAPLRNSSTALPATRRSRRP